MTDKYIPRKLKINRDVAEKWIEALRSRRYKQTTSTLRQKNDNGKDGFCCLGVLCDIAVKEGIIPEPTYDEELGTYMYGKKITSYDSLPPAVMKWAGMGSKKSWSSGDVDVVDWTENEDTNYSYTDSLSFATLNDEHKFTFKKIATVIEKAIDL